MIANSLFITGCWKTTWAWIEETGNGREEKRTSLAVTLDQGSARETQAKKGIYANQSRDVDSRKLFLSVMLDQSQQRRLRKQTGIVMQTKS